MGLTLIGLCALFLPIQIRLAIRNHRPLLGARTVFLAACVSILVLQLSFIFAGVYFSDDSVRHMYDGLQLLRGESIYIDPPTTLGPVEGLLPNHPELASVYLPFTQLQAVVGAALHPHFGFPLVYHLLLAVSLAFSLRELPSHGRRLLAILALSPFFLIASASRHADVQGMMLVILGLALVEKRESSRDFWAGLAAGVLPALKPVGLVWALFLLADLTLRRRRLPRAWLAGVLVSALALSAFSVAVLWRDWQSLVAFTDTVRFFADWFIAYNPVILMRTWLTDIEQRTVIVEFRREILTLLLGGLFLMPLIATARNIRGTLPSGLSRLLRRLLRESLVWVLVLGVLAAGVWHPWYFVWWLPALSLTGRFRAAAFLPGLLVLFYVPVAILRVTGHWEYDLFVFCVFCYVSAWFWLTRNRRGAVT